MAITEWHTPIHECQKGEVQRERCYLEPYFFFNGNLKDYAELLQYAYDKKYTPGKLQTNSLHEEFLEKTPICFHPYDVKNEKPPSHYQLKEWSKGTNTSCDEKHSWDERRTSKRNEINRLADENIAAKVTELMPYVLTEVIKGLKETDDAVEFSKASGNFTPHQSESATKSRMHVVDSLQKISGKDKDYKLKADVEADVNKQTTIHNQKWEELVEAFRSGRQERESTS